MNSRWAGLGGVVAFVFAVGGCGSPDLSEVPTNATAPFLCDGVPLTGAELILGGPVEVERTSGVWGDGPVLGFRCTVVLKSDDRREVLVSEVDVRGEPMGTDAGQLKQMASQADPEHIEADADGAGYVYGRNPEPLAGWVCHGRYLTVEPLRVGVEERDQRADAAAYLVSMLPWACGDEDPHKQTVVQ